MSKQVIIRQKGKSENDTEDISSIERIKKRIKRFVHNIMPARLFKELSYTDNSQVRNSPGLAYLVYAMRFTDLYDPDPLVLSGSVSNFKEVMQFYLYYRVRYCLFRWVLANLETFPLCAGIVLSNSNLTGSISSISQCQDAFENDFKSQVHTIAGKGGMDRTVIEGGAMSHQLLGSLAQFEGDQNYSGIGLATPAIPLWANFIVWSPTGASMTNGYVNMTKLTFGAEFFGRINNRT